MNKVYRCVDCLKEFYFDYSDLPIELDLQNPDSEENLEKIKNYNRNVNFQVEINICQDCLKFIRENSTTSMDNRREANINVKKVCQERIEELKNKKESEEEFKDYNEEKEKELKEKLEQMKKEVNENEDKLHNLLTNLESTEKKEDEFWKEYKNLEKDIFSIERNLSQSNDAILDYKNKIKSFEGNNIFSDLFEISINEKFGIINGCSFNDPLNYSHFDNINAGWGYIAFLTKLILIKYKIEVVNYDLIPLGNFSVIRIKINNRLEQFGLYLTDKQNSKSMFNVAMFRYLEYLNAIMKYLYENKILEEKKMEMCPKIEGDKINGRSIKIDSEHLDNWYQAMKNLLIILKFLMAQILSQENKAFKNTIDTVELINIDSININQEAP
jgi:uncharacterized protein YukE